MTRQVSIDELEDFAKDFFTLVKDRDTVAFHGEMGSGKTTLISALCKYLNVVDPISSPTYSIINEYNTINGDVIYHIDLYRLNNREEISRTGVEDCIASGETCFVEWPEKAPDLFDEKTVHVFISTLSESVRMVKINTPSGSDKAKQS
jgi:tRNA threonylcarbamoyladenosine biosynthesis protein TsaE